MVLRNASSSITEIQTVSANSVREQRSAFTQGDAVHHPASAS